MRSAVVVAGAAAALAGCGGGGDDDGGYPQEAVDNFVAQCRKEPQTTARGCRCVIDRLEQTMQYEEFKAADEALRSDREPDAESLRKLKDAVDACS